MQNMSPGKSALGLDANVVAGLCYIPVCYLNLILSIITLVTDKTNYVPANPQAAQFMTPDEVKIRHLDDVDACISRSRAGV